MNFDRIARAYRWMEFAVFGRALWRARICLLPRLHSVKRALLLGDGDGRFTSYFAQRFPDASVLYVDRSSRMLALARRRCINTRANNVEFINVDIRELPASAAVAEIDLIVSHFVLDCLSDAEVHAVVTALRKEASTGTRWLISEFAVPALQPWRALGTALVKVLYWGARLTTGLPVRKIPNYPAALHSAGFVLAERRSSLFGLLRAELWTLGRVGKGSGRAERSAAR